jgi:hypothetical protein
MDAVKYMRMHICTNNIPILSSVSPTFGSATNIKIF